MRFVRTIQLLLYLTFFSSLLIAQVNTERYRQDSDSGFTASIDIEALAQTGNTDFQFLGLGGRLNFNRNSGYSFLVFSGGYGWNDGKQFSNELITHLRNVEALDDWLQLEAFIQFDYNRKRKLVSRELIGAGLRYKILTNENLRLRLGTAYFFEAEQYDLEENASHDKHTYSHRLSSYITFEIDLKNDVKFLSVSYFQPDLNDFADYRMISENSIILNLSKLFDFNIKFNLRYDATPPDEIKDLDTITKFGLTFKF